MGRSAHCRSAHPWSDPPSRFQLENSLALKTVNDFPHLFHAVEQCDPQTAEKLLPMVYEELRHLAAHRMASQPAGHTLQPTALVHEAFLRLTVNAEQTWADRRHFFAAASEAMRHILVDRARRKAAMRHGSNLVPIQLDDVLISGPTDDEHVIAVNDALDRLAASDAMAAELVKLRFFAGFTLIEAADLLGVSERTAKRIWSYSRAWLFDELQRTMCAA
jgi:RNA polymerase sigma factor (TIGR02999 family)